jgi:hypothetical protein
MSKIALEPNASGTGTFSIASPGTNTDRTLTLPDATGTVVLADATQTLTNKSIAASQLTGDVAAARITTALNATGSAPIYACRAWVNFNGTGTVAIRASGNVSSITDNGTGNYTINFTTAMPDVNYSLVGMGGVVNGEAGVWGAFVTELHNSSSFIRTTTSLRFVTSSFFATIADAFVCNVAVFR